MGVTISVHTAVIIVFSVGAMHIALAVLFGALTFYVACSRKAKAKVRPSVKDSFREQTPSVDEAQTDSAYGTNTSNSVPSSSMSTNSGTIIQSHPPRPIKSLVVSKLIELHSHDSTSSETTTNVIRNNPFPGRSAATPLDPLEREVGPRHGETDAEGVAATRVINPVKRTNSYLRASVIAEQSSEPFTVLTVHKSTLKRKPKTSRSDSVKPLVDKIESKEFSNEEEEEEGEGLAKELNQSALNALGYSSESSRKSKASPSSRRIHLVGSPSDQARPPSRKAARSESTKPLMFYEEVDDFEESTDWNAVIQGVESPSRRQSLVLENLGATPPTSRFMLDESTSNIPVQTTPTRRQSLVLENQSATPYTHRPKSGASSTGSAKRQSLVLENLETEESLKTLHSDLLDIVTSL